MNGKQHAALPEWVFGQLTLPDNVHILDIGCGGGANIKRLLKLCPNSHVTGLDISKLALELTTDENYPAIADGYCTVVGGNAVQMPLAKEIFDLAFAFETIYYWSMLAGGIAGAYGVLSPGGMVVIANELDGLSPADDQLAHALGTMRVYTPQEIETSLTDAGFTDINVYHDEQRRFLCLTAKKP